MIALLTWLALLQQDYKDELPRLKPTEAADAIKTFKLQPGWRIELVASEPLVSSPADLAFDEEGRLWVVEMVDYPFNEAEGNPPQGRLVVLEDKDGDGRYDTRRVIADKIQWPTGLALWDGGAYVTAAPALYYLKEDVRKVVQSGFGTQNVQGLANNIKWGLDNWFHASSGSNGGTIAPAGVSISGRDFRFRPSGEFEPLSGGGQFGNSFDDYGRRFVCSNANSARHVVLDDAFLHRNPYYAVSAVTASIAAEGDAGTLYRTSPQEPWRVLRTKLRAEGKVRGQVEGITTFTAATGIFFLNGRLYVGDVSHNLIHRKSLTPNGTTFRAERIDKESEFLTSTDNWFRPANFASGPDGALYVCDLYRECIEHPHSVPDFIKKHLDMTSGKERGRIWRIVDESAPKLPKPTFNTLDGLVEAFASPIAWRRQTAARLIYQKQDKQMRSILENLTGAKLPETRAAALWALEGLGFHWAQGSLTDVSPDVREQAVKLAPIESLYDLNDDAPRVKFALACRMAESKDPRAKALLERLKPGADRWLQTAIAISSGEKTAEKAIKKVDTEAPVQVGDRRKVVEAYRGSIEAKGDAARGLEVYRKICIQCHRKGKEGSDVGPDLATVKQRTPEELIIAILDPNREVNPLFVAVRILTTGGQVLDGIVAAENATSVTLKRQGGEVDTILKVRIDKMVRSPLSLMPEGLEKTVDAQQMSDLIQFIKE